jgi:23S rRNA (cytidine1920-2'-O)/16S rRNA (cytidine1409-2'-O)-methyltransferase
MQKKRLDVLIVEKELAESRNQAQRLIMAGEVLGNGNQSLKPSETYSDEVKISLKENPPFLSRGGEKLEAALQAFRLTDLEGKVCADIGASTGGFTDCLLQHGAGKIYAVDVGYGQLHWKLRNDARVVVMEKNNVRNLQKLPDEVDLVVVDVSFISLRTIFPVLKNLMKTANADMITLIKPQFEAGRQEAAKGRGVIKDHAVHYKVLKTVLQSAQEQGLYLHGLIQSPIKGPKGNIEFLAHFRLEPAKEKLETYIQSIMNTMDGVNELKQTHRRK